MPKNDPSKAELFIQVLNLQDEIDDMRAGIDLWRDVKVSQMNWSQVDEVLVRWIEHGRQV